MDFMVLFCVYVIVVHLSLSQAVPFIRLNFVILSAGVD